MKRNEKILLDSMVKFDQRGFRHHDVKDVNMSGVFVVAKDGMLSKLSTHMPVEVALKMRTNGVTKIHIFKAEVTRVSRDGAQLQFNHGDVDAYSALLHLGLSKDS